MLKCHIIRNHHDCLIYFIDYLLEMGMPTDPTKITKEHTEAFIDYLLNQRKPPASPSTAATRYRGLQAYFKWAAGDDHIIAASPMRNQKPPDLPEKKAPVLDDTTIRAILRACQGESLLDRRDMAVVRLLLDTGLRRSELAKIQLEDVDLDQQRIAVMGKGARQRTVFYGRKAARDLDRYL